MPQVVFLDTNVMLDYLEGRNQEVIDIVSQLILLHEMGKIILATSIFNIAELLDKEFEIHYIGHLINQRFSFDEIWKKKNDREEIRKSAQACNNAIRRKINRFVFEKSIMVLTPKFENNNWHEDYAQLYSLIYEAQLDSQDAMIVVIALQNDVTYFLSNDSNLVRQLNEKSLIDAYSLRDPGMRESFKNNVINSLMEELK